MTLSPLRHHRRQQSALRSTQHTRTPSKAMAWHARLPTPPSCAQPGSPARPRRSAAPYPLCHPLPPHLRSTEEVDTGPPSPTHINTSSHMQRGHAERLMVGSGNFSAPLRACARSAPFLGTAGHLGPVRLVVPRRSPARLQCTRWRCTRVHPSCVISPGSGLLLLLLAPLPRPRRPLGIGIPSASSEPPK